MRITDGNLFEAMRLVLPEHRDLMRQMEREGRKRKQPILSEDEWGEIEYGLKQALHQKSKIRIRLFDPYEDEIWEGVPIIKGNRVFLNMKNGMYEVPLQRVVKIEVI